MRKFIVTTTINKPTEALIKFNKLKDWTLLVVGDMKTPGDKYKGFNYLGPDYQHLKYPRLSQLIGWNCIQRRNIGFIEAYRQGADIVATVDDDNIPLEGWGEDLAIGKETLTHFFNTELPAFDPLCVTNYSDIWHRGYPLELVKDRRRHGYSSGIRIKPDIQADLWIGDPDVDAVCRVAYQPIMYDYHYGNPFPIAADKPAPFNSQNTFLSRKVLKDYFLFPYVGRMDDIWAAYYVQSLGYKVVFGKPSVFQKRNPHNIIEDMKAEYLGYEHNLEIVKNAEKMFDYMPKKSIAAFHEYQAIMSV